MLNLSDFTSKNIRIVAMFVIADLQTTLHAKRAVLVAWFTFTP
jgi:hypothetical protein